MSKKNRTTRKQRKQKRQANDNALSNLVALDLEARERGLVIRIGMINGHSRQSAVHMMFNRLGSGERVLNYWPSTGTWLDCHQRKGKAATPEEALRIAVRRSGREPEDVRAMNCHLMSI